MRLTLFDAVLFGAIIILLAGNTLNALIIMVLSRGALLRLGALCCSDTRSALLSLSQV